MVNYPNITSIKQLQQSIVQKLPPETCNKAKIQSDYPLMSWDFRSKYLIMVEDGIIINPNTSITLKTIQALITQMPVFNSIVQTINIKYDLDFYILEIIFDNNIHTSMHSGRTSYDKIGIRKHSIHKIEVNNPQLYPILTKCEQNVIFGNDMQDLQILNQKNITSSAKPLMCHKPIDFIDDKNGPVHQAIIQTSPLLTHASNNHNNIPIEWHKLTPYLDIREGIDAKYKQSKKITLDYTKIPLDKIYIIIKMRTKLEPSEHQTFITFVEQQHIPPETYQTTKNSIRFYAEFLTLYINAQYFNHVLSDDQQDLLKFKLGSHLKESASKRKKLQFDQPFKTLNDFIDSNLIYA